MAEPVEHRLALVLNGGISLAVWMGGVAQEIDNLRRACNGLGGKTEAARRQSTAADAEARLRTLWKQAADAHGETITVDVIGGTSAGGLNGVFLAAAIARGATMDALRKIWISDAQLSTGALLTPQRPTSTSLLNGGFFLRAIADSLDAIGPESPDDARHVSLTTTASAFAGLPRYIVDSAGAQFAQPDHRRRYRFEHTHSRIHYARGREGWAFTPPEPGHRDFALGDEEVRESLSRAGRATASIPGVFEPVEETGPLFAKRVWPTWPTAAPGDDRREWLLDGGLLDNSPFTPVLELVAQQSVAATWRRTVCYIDPDAAVPPPDAPTAGPPGTPPPWDLAVLRLQTFPGEVGFRADMDLLGGLIRSGRASEDLARFERLLAEPGTDASDSLDLGTLATGLLPLYRRSRATAAVFEALDTVNGASDLGLMAPTQLLDVADVALTEHPWLPAAVPASDADLDGRWLWGLAGAERLVRLLLHSLRTARGAGDARVAVSDVLHRIAAVRIAVGTALHDDAPTRPWRPGDAASVAKLIDAVYVELGVPQTLGTLVHDAATAFAATRTRPTTALEVVRAALRLELVDGAPGLPVKTEPSPIFDFARFGIGDIPGFLAPAATPGAASAQTGSVLYGSRLGHFAAFGRPEWRAWDWMWGRIHGAMHLGRLLDLTDAQLQPIIEQIILTEGSTPDAVRKQLPDLLNGETTKDMVTALSADGRLAEAADALFDLLGTPAATDPPVHHLVVTIGAFVNAAFGRRTRGTKQHPVVRLIAWLPRRLVWRLLRRARF